MWTIIEGPAAVPPLKDHHRFRFAIERGEDRRELFVEINGTAAACDPDALPSPVSDAVRTNGLDAVERYVDETNRDGTELPSTIEITTTGEWKRIAPTFA